MMLRQKILIALMVSALLPLVIMWAMHGYLHKKSVEHYQNFFEGALMDWYDGEMENLAYESSLLLQKEMKRLEMKADYKVSYLESLLSISDDPASVEGPLYSLFKSMSDVEGSAYEVVWQNTSVKDSLLYPRYKNWTSSDKTVNEAWYQRALTQDDVVVHVGEYAVGDTPVKLIFAKRALGPDGDVKAVLISYYNMPELFQSVTKTYLTPNAKRNSQIEGFLLRVNPLGHLELVAGQRKDFQSKLLYWGMPFLSGWLSDEAKLLQDLQARALRNNRVVVTPTQLNGKRYMWTFSPIRGGEFFLGMLIPLQAVADQVSIVSHLGADKVSAVASHFNTVFAMLILFILFMSWFVSNFILKRVQKFYNYLERVDEQGECTPYVNEYDDEVASLSHKVADVFRHQRERYENEKEKPLT